VYDGTSKKIYVDGQLDASEADSGDIPANNQPVRIASWGDPIGPQETRYFSGSIDEVAIFARALSAEEIHGIYRNLGKLKGNEDGLAGYWSFDDEADVVRDGSPNGNHGVLVGRPQLHDAHRSPEEAEQAFPIPGAGYVRPFDGVDDFLVVPDSEQLDVGDPFTVEAWVKVRDLSGQHVILSKEAAGDNGWALLVTQENDRYALTFSMGDGEQTHGLSTRVAYERNQWHHVAASWHKNKAAVLVDGRLVSTGTFPAVQPARVPLRIGKASSDRGDHFGGMMSEIRIWRLQRSEEEIRRDMKRRLTGREVGLVACWPLSEPPGPVAPDLTGHGHDAQAVTWGAPPGPRAAPVFRPPARLGAD